MVEFVIPWLAVARGAATLTQLALMLPRQDREATDYLYESGFFGDGRAADARRDMALGLNAMVNTMAALPEFAKSKEERANDADILREALKTSGIYYSDKKYSDRLIKLVQNPPDAEAALGAIRGSGSLMDRVIGALSFGRFGSTARASRQWTALTALEQAYNIIDAEKADRLSQPDNVAVGDDRFTQPGQVWKKRAMEETGTAAAKEERTKNASDVAFFLLRNPRALATTIRQQKPTLLLADETIKDGVARSGGVASGRGISFTELLSEAAQNGLLVDSSKRQLDYDDARTMFGIAAMKRVVESFESIKEHTLPLMRLPESSTQPGVMNLLSDQLSRTAEHLVQVTRSVHTLEANWPDMEKIGTGFGDMPRKFLVRELTNRVVDLAERSEATASAFGFDLARQAKRLSEKLDNADRYEPAVKEALFQEVKAFNKTLTEFHRDLHFQHANAAMLLEWVADAALKGLDIYRIQRADGSVIEHYEIAGNPPPKEKGSHIEKTEGAPANVRLRSYTSLPELAEDIREMVEEKVPAHLLMPRGHFSPLVAVMDDVRQQGYALYDNFSNDVISDRRKIRLGADETAADILPITASKTQLQASDAGMAATAAEGNDLAPKMPVATATPIDADAHVLGQTAGEGEKRTLH